MVLHYIVITSKFDIRSQPDHINCTSTSVLNRLPEAQSETMNIFNKSRQPYQVNTPLAASGKTITIGNNARAVNSSAVICSRQ